MLWKTLRHSDPEWFHVAYEGGVCLGSFVIIDDRLITVTVAGHRRTMELGSTPPLALAERIAVELLSIAGLQLAPSSPSPRH
jgi:hypothetical protein